MKRSFFAFAFIAAIAIPSIGAAQKVIGPNVQERATCYAGDRLYKAAIRDGLVVMAEALSTKPDSSGAYVYFMLDTEDKTFGVIASVKDENGPRQCNWGVGANWNAIPIKKAVLDLDRWHIVKSHRVCGTLPELLNQLETANGEVPFGRYKRSPEIDFVLTASGAGEWSAIRVTTWNNPQMSGEFEYGCLASWGVSMRLKPAK